MNKQRYHYLVIIFLIVASCIAYSRTLGNGFVNLDDNAYIYENSNIKSGITPESIKWAFTETYFYWQPLTRLSHISDWSLFGDYAGGHHFISLLFHISVALILFLFLNKMTKDLWLSAFATAFFTLHPLRVESVAWAAERKDVLSMFFGLASLYAYACYTESSRLLKYFYCLILFVFSLMAKPLFVTLPFILLLMDYWPLGRWDDVLKKERVTATPSKNRFHPMSRILGEKVPFIVVTIIFSIVTLWAQNKSGAVISMANQSFVARITNAIISYVSYLGKTFWPVDLAVFYPCQYPFPLWQISASCFVLIGMTVFVIYAVKKLPFLFVGWFWYLGTLIPVIGLVQVGKQAMADRHTYLPSIGIAMMLVWGVSSLFRRNDNNKKILFTMGIAVMTILTLLTWRQCMYWENTFELYNHAIRVTKNNFFAYKGRGMEYYLRGRHQQAIEDYNMAIRLMPSEAETYNNRGAAYGSLAKYERAIEDFNQTIRLNPDHANAYFNRGFAYSYLGQDQQAIQNYDMAIRLKPDYTNAYVNRGLVHLKLGNKNLGCFDAQKACALNNCKLLEDAKSKRLCR